MDSTLTPHTESESVFEIKSSATSETQSVQIQSNSEDYLKDTRAAEKGELIFVLLSSNDDIKHRVVVSFPNTYEEALDKAIQSFKAHQPENTIDNTKLCRQVKTSKSEDVIWADICPPDWAFLIQPGQQVALLALNPIKAPSEDPDFVRGYVKISFGLNYGFGTVWTSTKPMRRFQLPVIGRPRSYEEANAFIHSRINWPFKARFHRLRRLFHLKKKAIQDPRFTRARSMFGETVRPRYFKFTAVDHWIPFPDAAYTDDAEWRKFVPRPGETLGFMSQ
ncbi:hypothetical protein M422DRAFT_257080 [Sphaerobolus stellatus SS14]|uniref:Uncharacterized protein n=1 Tax=Sphaerobolus stellatus (strain SS14) TaxID=990650 RepID=A0A0C9VPE6_SPHS4|nr:hypothetical protein M422DRAFT_257080 [Sphaerobolus stellatus SS14]